MAKTISKSFLLSNPSQKPPFLLFWCILCMATPSSSQNINNTAHVSRLSFHFLWLWRNAVDSPYLEHPLSWTSCEFEINRVLCMINIWNIDILERTYNILCSYKFQVNGITPTNIRKLLGLRFILNLGLCWRKQFLLESFLYSEGLYCKFL